MTDLAMKNLSVYEEEGQESRANPDDRRTGGQDMLKEGIRSALGMEKYVALMSGAAASARKGYTELWYEWVRFCAIRGHAPWLVSNGDTWGELIYFSTWLRETIRQSASA